MKIALIIIVIAIAVVWSVYTGGLPKIYRTRSCTGKNWKSKFPDTPKEDIRTFLLLFADAFAFSSKQKLKFNPNDKILDIYKALYPAKWMADSLEVETLAEDIEREYNVNISGVWHENITLGDLFSEVQNA
jgi:propanediol dehydratase small subunit